MKMVIGFPLEQETSDFSAINGLLPLFFVCFSFLRFEEEDR